MGPSSASASLFGLDGDHPCPKRAENNLKSPVPNQKVRGTALSMRPVACRF
jgi:hypothetical protein